MPGQVVQANRIKPGALRRDGTGQLRFQFLEEAHFGRDRHIANADRGDVRCVPEQGFSNQAGRVGEILFSSRAAAHVEATGLIGAHALSVMRHAATMDGG